MVCADDHHAQETETQEGTPAYHSLHSQCFQHQAVIVAVQVTLEPMDIEARVPEELNTSSGSSDFYDVRAIEQSLGRPHLVALSLQGEERELQSPPTRVFAYLHLVVGGFQLCIIDSRHHQEFYLGSILQHGEDLGAQLA